VTYWQFHVVFTLPLFFLILWFSRDNLYVRSQKGLLGTLILLVLAIGYTTPWDSYLIHQEIWKYEPGRVLGTLFKIPFEEYFFFVIQTITGCLFTGLILRHFRSRQDHRLNIGSGSWALVAVSWTALAVLALTAQPEGPFRYLFLVGVWATPILILQWALGLPVLWLERKAWWISVVSLTGYFWVADSFAIRKQIWTFPAHTISGWELFGMLPIEEALFFLVTNLMVVQGFILFTTVDLQRSNFFKFERG
jgi:lycopene cyclase domain-containing protein